MARDLATIPAVVHTYRLTPLRFPRYSQPELDRNLLAYAPHLVQCMPDPFRQNTRGAQRNTHDSPQSSDNQDFFTTYFDNYIIEGYPVALVQRGYRSPLAALTPSRAMAAGRRMLRMTTVALGGSKVRVWSAV
jgi:hypothetical protein